MKNFWSIITDNETSLPIPNCNVYVYVYGGTTLATIYSDDGITPLINPFQTDVNGRYNFYVAAGKYYLKFVKTGYDDWTSDPITIPDEVDEADTDTTKNKYVSNKLMKDLEDKTLTKTDILKFDNIQCPIPLDYLRHLNTFGQKENTFYINKDYVSGDEDAILSFNNGMASLRLDYLLEPAGLWNVRSFVLNERLFTERIFDSPSTDFCPGENTAWVRKLNIMALYADTVTSGYCVPYSITLHNRWNHTAPEIAAHSIMVNNIWADSKAKSIGYDANMVKTSPCVTSNSMIGFTASLGSSIDPTSFLHGCGFAAGAYQSLGECVTGVRQHAAFLSRGNVGWKYPFLALDIDDSTVLFSIDRYGNAYFKRNVTLSGLVSDPVAPVEGEIWYNTTDHKYKGYDGTEVILLG